MASQPMSMNRSTPMQMDRFLQEERRLWEQYGLTPVDRSVDLGAQHIRIQEVGSGDPVVFIHGTGGSGACFAPLVAELPGFRCLVVDRPGWGLSSPIRFPHGGFAEVASDFVRNVFDGLNLTRAHLVGASIGGLWALRFLGQHAERVDRLVILGSGPLLDELRLPPFPRMLRSPLGQILMRLPERRPILNKQLRGLGHGASLDAGRFPEAFFDWRIAASRETRWMRSERDLIRSITDGRGFLPGTGLTDADLHGTRCPTLMVLGDADPNGTPEMWRDFTERMPHGAFELVPDAGHLVWFDDANRVGGRVSSFLAG